MILFQLVFISLLLHIFPWVPSKLSFPFSNAIFPQASLFVLKLSMTFRFSRSYLIFLCLFSLFLDLFVPTSFLISLFWDWKPLFISFAFQFNGLLFLPLHWDLLPLFFSCLRWVDHKIPGIVFYWSLVFATNLSKAYCCLVLNQVSQVLFLNV